MQKTNAMRMLDKDNIKYEIITYEVDENDLSGTSAAAKTNVNPEEMFKTLVLWNAKKEMIVCCIPVNEELDLKKVAKASKNKNIEMLPLKLLTEKTGYIRGGCSPIGMKKVLPTYIDETMLLFDVIYISAGARGVSFKMKSEDLIAYTNASMHDLCKN